MGTPKFLRYSIRRALANVTLGPSGGQVYPSVYQYNFDGIDDYATVPNIELLAGDVVEFDFKIENASTMFQPLLNNSNDNPLTLIRLDETNTWDLFSFSNASVDGISIVNGSPVTLSANIQHFVATANQNCFIDEIGTRGGLQFLENVIKNLRVTRTTPTDTHPNLLWTMGDGPATTVMRQTLPTVGNFDGEYVNFNDERWERV